MAAVGKVVPEVPTWLSLTFIVVAMAVATIASIIKMKRDGKSFPRSGPAGIRGLPGHREVNPVVRSL